MRTDFLKFVPAKFNISSFFFIRFVSSKNKQQKLYIITLCFERKHFYDGGKLLNKWLHHERTGHH